MQSNPSSVGKRSHPCYWVDISSEKCIN